MDQLLTKYVKIAEVDSGHILELDKTMKNKRFMTTMNDQYTNKSDNEEDGKDDVEDIDPGDKLVTTSIMELITTMMMTITMKKKMMTTIGTAVMMTMRMVMPIKERDSLLQPVYLQVIIEGKYFNFRIVSMYKLIYCN
jgi:hypothetical protein